MIWLWLSCVALPEEGTPRALYNDGLVLMEANDWTTAQERLLSARDLARTDQELRADAAYNLALAYVKEAQSLEEADPEKAADQYKQAIGWFRDVIHLQGDQAEDARHNLEVALLSKQGLVDRLTEGENGFAPRLQRLLENVQVLRQSVQELIWKMDQHGDRQRPAGYEQAMTKLAVQVRELSTDALEIANLSSDEIQRINLIPETERTPEEQNQWVSMQLFLPYMDLAREEMATSRRYFRRVNSILALKELDDTVLQLNRAQDQLLALPDRIGSLVSAQQQLLQQTEVLIQSQRDGLVVQGQELVLPSWLTSMWLSEQQQDVEVRTKELDTFCSLILESIKQSESVDLLQQENIQRTSIHIDSALKLMMESTNNLSIDQLSVSIIGQQEILRSLILAWENFADVKTVVEWTHRDNQMMRELLNQTETVQQQFPNDEQKQNEYQRLLAQNQLRLARLEQLLKQEKATALQQLQQSEGQDSAIEQVESVYEMADQYRNIALAAVTELNNEKMQKAQALEQIEIVHDSVRQLRMIFFTVIEHLQDAAAQQEDLWQRTGTGSTKPYEQMLLDTPVWLLEQDQLQQRVEWISSELQSMADEMANQGNAQQSEALGDAFVETGLAKGFMKDVVEGMTQVVSDQTVSHDFSEVVNDQQQAIEALLRAIEALQPPQQGDQDQEDGEQDQNQQQQEQQEQSEMSQREAQRKMQAAKEKEAQRDQDNQEAVMSNGYVEKDW